LNRVQQRREKLLREQVPGPVSELHAVSVPVAESARVGCRVYKPSVELPNRQHFAVLLLGHEKLLLRKLSFELV
jgi:hypothetical protein